MLFLRWYLWIAPQIILAICAAMLWHRRLQNRFPVFTAYVCVQLLGFLPTLVLSLLIPRAIISLGAYRWVVVAATSIADVLELAVFYELSDLLIFRRSPAASKLRPLARWTVASLILVAAGSSALIADTGHERVILTAQFVQYSASVVSIGFIMALLVFTRALRISWSGLPEGIALGFAVTSCAELSAAALISVLGKIGWIGIDSVGMGAFHISALIWLIYLVLPSKPPTFAGQRPGRADLETWGQELQKMVR